MTVRSERGRLGEDLTCAYLAGKGYRVIERNCREPCGELDIVARSADGLLVFIEVKTFRQEGDLRPEDELTKAKLVKFKRVASLYAGRHPELIDDRLGWRLDLVAVVLEPKPVFRHYENVV